MFIKYANTLKRLMHFKYHDSLLVQKYVSLVPIITIFLLHV